MVTILKKIDSLNHDSTVPSITVSKMLLPPPTESGAMLDSLPRRLELPVFEGVNPEGCLFHAER